MNKCPQGCLPPPNGMTMIEKIDDQRLVLRASKPGGDQWWCWHLTYDEARQVVQTIRVIIGDDVWLPTGVTFSR